MQLATPGSRYLWLAVLALSPGCGAERDCRGSAGELGSCCQNDADCVAGLSCFEQIPAGLCSVTCLGAADCPATAYCVTVESRSLGQLGKLCLAVCTDGRPCPAGLACTQTNQGELEVCFPPF